VLLKILKLKELNIFFNFTISGADDIIKCSFGNVSYSKAGTLKTALLEKMGVLCS
jgi:hypothetical protein